MGATRPVAPDAILIVDPDGALLRLTETGLERAGYVVVHARTAVEAIAASRLSRPLVIAVACELPGAAGLCRQLDSDPRAGEPVVMQVRAQRVPAMGGQTQPVDLVIDLEDAHHALSEILPLDPDLLGRLDERARQVREVRSASPLTGLPGNAAIRAELGRRLAQGTSVGLLYADLDGFKPYNDHYGFLRGDDVLRTFADLLRDIARAHPQTFVGHIGGDDFAVLAPDPEPLADEIIERFRRMVPTFYDQRDVRRGWTPGRDRRGRHLRWPLLTVSIGIACSRPGAENGALALVDVATEMKTVAKRRGGNTIAVDRRATSGGPPRVLRARGLPWSPREVVRRAAGAVAVSLLVVALTLPAGVALASTAGPGDRLWAVRVVAEEARLRIAIGPEARTEVHLDIAAARVGDLIVRPREGAQAEVLLDDLVTHLAAAQDLSGGVSPEASAGMKVTLDRQVRILEALADQRCADGPSVSCSALGQTAAILADRARAADDRGSTERAPGPRAPGDRPSGDRAPGVRAQTGPPQARVSDQEPVQPPGDRGGPASPPVRSDRPPPSQDGVPPGRLSHAGGNGQAGERHRPSRPDAPTDSVQGSPPPPPASSAGSATDGRPDAPRGKAATESEGG